MKYDSWETDFRSHLHEWDIHDPRPELWEKIQVDIQRPIEERKIAKGPTGITDGMACAVVIAFIVGGLGGKLTQQNLSRSTVTSTQKVVMNEADHSVETQLLAQLNHLTTMYQDLQKELGQSENPERVLEAMKENLDMQQMVLSQMQLIVKRINTIQHDSPTRL